MGRKNFLIEGGSGTGKTAVCHELRRRGYQAINGDRELAYQGDPETGSPVPGVTGTAVHHHHIWDVDKVKSLVADRTEALTFFCGGSRNVGRFIGLFDAVFVLEVDAETLARRLDERPLDEWGGQKDERRLIERLHQTRAEIPSGAIPIDAIPIDATAPLPRVVDDILRRVQASGGA